MTKMSCAGSARIALMAALAGCAAPAWAQKDAQRGAIEAPVILSKVPVLRVGPHGRPSQTPPVFTDTCNVVASLTDANFAGGSFVVQAGFAQNEMAAATYTVAAAEFPIKINLTEVILATSNSTVTTTTGWSLLYYSGTPTNGTLIDTFTSDGTIVPHAIIPPGTNGVNIQFSVDPQDPEQLFIPDNGSHQFTVAFRIDHHNNQTQNPCLIAPPTSSNAFPCTDVGGLQFSGSNWLFGVNCGQFGCPANGGWATFTALPGGCRPSGDWVMRTTWSGINCTPGVGACCHSDGTCQVQTQTECAGIGGVYRGDGTTCAAANCPQPGACCKPDGTCVQTTATGCASLSGTYQGDNTLCANVTCPQPPGACCFSNGNCLLMSQGDCTTASGVWLGGGTACNAGQCPTGACCFSNGSCLIMTPPNCTTAAGVFHGINVTCAAAACPQPSGACCLSNGNCLNLTSGDCSAIPGSSWAGAGTTCASGVCSAGACYPNCDHSTTVPFLNVQDFGCFLNSFAAGQTYANCDNSTTAPVLNVQDFGCFLNKFAGGCSAP